MTELLILLVQLACLVLVVYGGILAVSNSSVSSAGLHIFDESGPIQSRREEDALAPRPDQPARRVAIG